MRLRTLTLTIILAVLATGIIAAPAVAGDPSLPSLKQQLRHAQQSRQRAHVRARTAAADLAGARELLAATNGAGAQAPAASPAAPPTGMSQRLAASLLGDGVVTVAEITALQTRSTAAARVAHRWTVKVRTLQRRVRGLAADRAVEPARPVEAAHRDRLSEVRRERRRSAPHDDAGVWWQSHRRRDVQGPLPVLPEHVGRQLEPMAAPEHLRRLGADPCHGLRPAAGAWARASGRTPTRWRSRSPEGACGPRPERPLRPRASPSGAGGVPPQGHAAAAELPPTVDPRFSPPGDDWRQARP